MTVEVDHQDCGHHNHRKKLFRRLFAAFLSLLILILFIILITWLIVRPHNPHFTLQDATLYAFNITGTTPTLLTTNLQITLSENNPNSRSPTYFKKLDIYGVYKNQQITLATSLPDTYTGHKDVTVWSPFLYGTAVPVAPYLAASLTQDQTAGTVLIDVKVFGKVKWKACGFSSKWYHFSVNCPAYIPFGRSGSGPAVKYQLLQKCNVDV